MKPGVHLPITRTAQTLDSSLTSLPPCSGWAPPMATPCCLYNQFPWPRHHISLLTSWLVWGFCFVVLTIELRASKMLGKHFTTELCPALLVFYCWFHCSLRFQWGHINYSHVATSRHNNSVRMLSQPYSTEIVSDYLLCKGSFHLHQHIQR
jgi:hypothetical protein